MLQRHKHFYRISKYDPTFRCDNIYIKNEWTSISDIGKKYEGQYFSADEYMAVEDNYLSAIERILVISKTKVLRISSIEDYYNRCPYRNNQRLRSKEDVLSVMRDCLREEYWCRLESHSLTMYCGYDYYVYIGCSVDCMQIEKELSNTGVFVEIITEQHFKN